MPKLEPLILVYGIRKGHSERYLEDLLATNCKNAADVEKVKAAAAKDGWHSFRVAYDDGSPPDFSKVLNRSKR